MKKYSKRLISLILSTIIIFSLSIINVSSTYEYNTKAEAIIVEGIKNKAESVNIASAVDIASFFTSDSLSSFMTDFSLRNPEYFYFDIESSSFWSNGKIQLEYTSHTDKQIADFNNKVDEIISKAQGMSDLDAVIFFHEYLMEICDYDYTYQHSNAYDCLIGKTCVCEGYAKAMLCFCKKMDIECAIVSSDYNNHAWNVVKIDGKMYYLDVTFDDSTGKQHNNLLSSGDQCEANDHKTGTYKNGTLGDWMLFGNVNCTKTFNDRTFDNAFWKTATNIMNYLNGTWYYTNGLDVYSCKYPESPIKLTNHNASDYRWYVFGKGSSYYSEHFSDVVEAAGKLYYSTATQIRSINTDGTNDQLVYTLSENEQSKGYIYDLKADGNKVYYYLSPEKFTINPVTNTPYFNVTYSSYITAHSHSFSEWTVISEPTCKNEGERQRACQDPNCNYTEKETIDKLSHIFDEWTETKAPSCTDDGINTRYCTLCNTSEEQTVPSTGHQFSQWEKQEDGSFKRLCTVCNKEETKPKIPSEPEYILGDANGDGKINAKDARAILRHTAKLEILGEAEQKAADVDKNGRINPKDAQIILKFVAKIIKSLA